MHQFDITPLAGLENTPLAFVTNSAFFMILTVAVIAVLMVVLTLSAKVVPGSRADDIGNDLRLRLRHGR